MDIDKQIIKNAFYRTIDEGSFTMNEFSFEKGFEKGVEYLQEEFNKYKILLILAKQNLKVQDREVGYLEIHKFTSITLLFVRPYKIVEGERDTKEIVYECRGYYEGFLSKDSVPLLITLGIPVVYRSQDNCECLEFNRNDRS